MTKITLLLITILISSLGANAQTRAAEVADPTAFAGIKVQQKIADCIGESVWDCGREVMMQLELVGFGGEDNFEEKEESFTYRSGVSIYLFSMLGTKPSFTNEWRTRVAFTKTRTGLRFVQAGTQYRCLVDGKRGNWTKTPCETSTPVPAYDFTTKTEQGDVESLDAFRFISVTGRGAATLSTPCRGSLLQCGLRLLDALYKPNGFESAKQKKNEIFEIRQGQGTKGIFLATAVGYEDDSVAGERVRIEFRRVGQTWVAENGSSQYLCGRGDNAFQWTKELCP